MTSTSQFLSYRNTRFGLDVELDLACLRNELDAQRISDVTDTAGHRYVDLVLEGGGTLGFALAGYVYALEHAGVRFRAIGGASAGAITALLLSASAPPDGLRATNLLNALEDLDLESFMDGHAQAERAVRKVLRKDKSSRSTLFWLTTIAPLLPHIPGILERGGLFRGEALRTWLSEILSKWSIESLRDLQNRLNAMPELIVQGASVTADHDIEPRLGLVSAEISTHSTAQLPRDAAAFWESPSEASPADFVRASMSVPLFFEPYRRRVPTTTAAHERWRSPAGLHFRGRLPRTAVLQDGGLVSNFPIDMWHSRARRVPRLPTFGARLGDARSHVHPIQGALDVLVQGFATARQARDASFIRDNPDYSRLVTEIDTRDINWLDFTLSAETQAELFARGVSAARTFLETFDFDAYKSIRASNA